MLLAITGMPVIGQQEAGQNSSSQTMDVFDALQENAWYLPTKDGKARLYVTSLGKGQTIIVLHGGPGNDFNYLVKAVRPHIKINRFVLFDQRGSLLSPVADAEIKNLTLKTLVDDLETLRQTLGEDKIVLFGHSFGTLLALSYYQAYPQHVGGLILSASVPPFTSKEKTFDDVIKEARQNLRRLRERPAVKAELQKEGVSDEKDLTPQQKSTRYKIDGLASLNLYHVERWREFQGGGVYYNRKVDDAVGDSIPQLIYDIRPAIEQNPVPITIIQGDNDYLDPSATSWQQLAEANPPVKIAVIKNASHYVWVDNPTEFYKQMARALRRTDTGNNRTKTNSLINTTNNE